MLSQLIYKLIGAFDAFNEYIGRGIAWLTSLLVLVFCFDVVSRYVFNKSQVAVFEAEWHIFSMIFLLGAAYTLRHDRHVRVDVFYSRFWVK
jgi:TRAP-type mannitol/chloroaromatic compound transport system permease small subunit